MEKEFKSLSDWIDVTNRIHYIKIKEFIKIILEDFNWFEIEDEKWEDTLKRHRNFIKKRAGSKLITK